jgi:hypothetical protein
MYTVLLIIVIWLAHIETPLHYTLQYDDLGACLEARLAAQASLDTPGVVSAHLDCYEINGDEEMHS